jgi:zinc transport system ATP-binding protein
MQGPALSITNLNLRLGASQILQDVNFKVSRGSIHCLIGPNGGGKTSTLRCILGQMPHTGEISIAWNESPSIGYIPQLIELEKTVPLTVEDFLTVMIQTRPAVFGLRKPTLNKVKEALARVGLEHKLHTQVDALSGGERQRLLFAQALIPKPGLLVLDEPMTSLDEPGVSRFESLINEQHRQGSTILWINHDLRQVQRMAQEVTIIDRTSVQSGPAEQLLHGELLNGVFNYAGGK